MKQLSYTTLLLTGIALPLSALAADKEVLTVYTYDSFTAEWGPGPQLEALFEEGCECDLQFVTAGDGAALLTRLRLEGDASDADVVMGFDQNLVEDALEAANFANISVNADFHIDWQHEKFAPFDWGHFAFVYNPELWKHIDPSTPVPTSLDELAASEFKIVIQDPRSSTPGLGFVLWVQNEKGEDAKDYWGALADNIVTVTPGWSEAYALFLEGEADMVLSYTTSPSYHKIAEEDDGFKAAIFDAGHPAQIELMGKIEGASPLADDFIAFMQSQKAQAVIPTTNWMYPAVKDVDLPDGFARPEDVKTLDFETTKAAREAAIENWLSGLRQ